MTSPFRGVSRKITNITKHIGSIDSNLRNWLGGVGGLDYWLNGGFHVHLEAAIAKLYGHGPVTKDHIKQILGTAASLRCDYNRLNFRLKHKIEFWRKLHSEIDRYDINTSGNRIYPLD